MSNSKFCVIIEVHPFFVQVLVCQMSKTCKNFVKNTCWLITSIRIMFSLKTRVKKGQSQEFRAQIPGKTPANPSAFSIKSSIEISLFWPSNVEDGYMFVPIPILRPVSFAIASWSPAEEHINGPSAFWEASSCR